MSLLSKFTSKFHSKQTTAATSSPCDSRLGEVIASIMKPSIKYDVRASVEVLTSYFQAKDEHFEQFFTHLQQCKDKDVVPMSMIHLLFTLHQTFTLSHYMYEIAVKMRESRFEWLNFEQLNQPRVGTEPDLPSPGSQQFYTEAEDNGGHSLMSFAQLYYTYLQRISANVDLYKSVNRNSYPYVNDKDIIEPKLMFLWLYKIQNTLNQSLFLLKLDLAVADVQKFIYNEACKFQLFVCKEVGKTVDYYATLPNTDTLSLFEIYMDAQKHYEVLRAFQAQAAILQLQSPAQPMITNNTLQDFFQFVSKLKVLNQFTFKRSLKVPNKQNPCMGIPLRNPNALHLKANSSAAIKHQEEEQNIPNLSNNSIELQEDVESLQEEKKKPKKQHLRGISTFQKD